MTIASKILNTLSTRLSVLPSVPPIALPNDKYAPVIGTMFLRANILPADTVTATVESLENHKGIYQVDVFVPAETGTFAVNNMADSIADHFAAERDLTGIRIRSITIDRGDRDGAWYIVPVSIVYDTYHKRS